MPQAVRAELVRGGNAGGAGESPNEPPHGGFAEAATVRALQTYLAGRTTGPVFLNRDGGRLGEPTVWRLIRRLARTAGIPAANQLSPHSLRHSAIISPAVAA